MVLVYALSSVLLLLVVLLVVLLLAVSVVAGVGAVVLVLEPLVLDAAAGATVRTSVTVVVEVSVEDPLLTLVLELPVPDN